MYHLPLFVFFFSDNTDSWLKQWLPYLPVFTVCSPRRSKWELWLCSTAGYKVCTLFLAHLRQGRMGCCDHLLSFIWPHLWMTSETLGQSSSNHVEPSFKGGLKICPNGHGPPYPYMINKHYFLGKKEVFQNVIYWKFTQALNEWKQYQCVWFINGLSGAMKNVTFISNADREFL